MQGSVAPIKLFWTVLLILSVSIGFALLALGHLVVNAQWTINNTTALSISFAFQILVVILSAEAWLSSLTLESTRRYTLSMFVISGLFNICKYIPGKIWGFAVRGFLIRSHASEKINFKDTVSDQVAMIHSGLSLALLLITWDLMASFLALSIIVVLISVIAFVPILNRTNIMLGDSRWSGFILISRYLPNVIEKYPLLYLRYVVIWLVLALSFGACVYSISPNTIGDPLLVLRLTVFGYFAGFIVFFLPSGIGARDGAFYLMLLESLSTENAAMVTVLHRVVVTLTDITLALPAIPILKTIISPNESI